MPEHEKAATEPQIIIRSPESIYQIDGGTDDGTLHGRWYFILYPLRVMPNWFPWMFCSDR
jgi:hypothetical protein